MSADTLNLAAEGGGGLFTPGGPGFEAPSVGIFFPSPWSWGDYSEALPYTSGITKYAVLLVVATALVAFFLWWTTRKLAIVPSRKQSIFEIVVLFIRDQISRPMIGVKGDRYLPLLVSLFLFIFMGCAPAAAAPAPTSGTTSAALVDGVSRPGGISSGASCWAFCHSLVERNAPQPDTSRADRSSAGTTSAYEVFFMN